MFWSLSSLSPLVATITGADVPTARLSTAQSIRLLQALAAVPDLLRRRGRRYSLQSILLIAVSAVLAGAGPMPRSATGLPSPDRRSRSVTARLSGATIRRVLMAVDPVEVQAAMTAWTLACGTAAATTAEQASLPRDEQRQLLAVDGKNVRGARQPHGQQTKLLAVIDHTHRLVLAQTEAADGNEIAAFITALDTLPQLRGCPVTADALHTQRGHADYMLGRGAHYLFTVETNQPMPHRALAALRWRAAPGVKEPGSDRGHGRIESRTATVIDLAGTDAGESFPARPAP